MDLEDNLFQLEEFTGVYTAKNRVDIDGYSRLRCKPLAGGWAVIQDWQTPYGVVPKGFWSDGVSVPYVFRWYIHRHGVLFKAAVLHDYLYKNAIKTKSYADNAFYYSARHYKVNRFKAYFAYLAVRWFGKGNYK